MVVHISTEGGKLVGGAPQCIPGPVQQVLLLPKVVLELADLVEEGDALPSELFRGLV